MSEIKTFKLNPLRVKTLDDIIVILDGMGITITNEAEDFETLKKYFDVEVVEMEVKFTNDNSYKI